MNIMDLFEPNIEKMKNKKNVKGLIKALNYKRNYMVREKAAEALGKIGDLSTAKPPYVTFRVENSNIREKALEPLIRAIEDESHQVAKKAIEALGKIGDSRAIEPLNKALKDQDRQVQEKAAEAIKTIKELNRKCVTVYDSQLRQFVRTPDGRIRDVPPDWSGTREEWDEYHRRYGCSDWAAEARYRQKQRSNGYSC